jgi:hypothetical protein
MRLQGTGFAEGACTMPFTAAKLGVLDALPYDFFG